MTQSDELTTMEDNSTKEVFSFVANDITAKAICAIVKGSDKFLTELHILFEREKIWLRQLDSGKNALIAWEFPMSSFQEYCYRHETDKPLEICIYAKKFLDLVDKAKKGLELQLYAKDNEVKKCVVTPIHSFRQKTELQLLLPPEEVCRKTSLNFDTEFEISGEVWKDVFREAAKMVSHIIISVGRDKNGNDLVRFQGESDNGNIDYEIRTEEAGDYAITNLRYQTHSKTMYAMSYLELVRWFWEGHKDVYVRAKLSTNKPIHLEATISGLTFSFILAPRVEYRPIERQGESELHE